MYIDTHCHLYPEFGFVTKTPEEIVEECIKNRVTQMWLAATEKADILWNLDFCKKYPKNLRTWVGWHPEQYLTYDNEFLVSRLEEHLGVQNLKLKVKSEKIDAELPTIVGIGEIGLDFAAHSKSTKEKQVEVFESQLKLARKYNLPVAIHCRDAFEETVEVMKSYKDIKYLWHCFNLSREKTEIIFSTFPNIYIGINAIFTYKSGEYIKESLAIVPLKKILIETDSPFLTPRPFKYSFNTPAGVKIVYSVLGTFLGIEDVSLEEDIHRNIIEFS